MLFMGILLLNEHWPDAAQVRGHRQPRLLLSQKAWHYHTRSQVLGFNFASAYKHSTYTRGRHTGQWCNQESERTRVVQLTTILHQYDHFVSQTGELTTTSQVSRGCALSSAAGHPTISAEVWPWNF